MTETTMRRLAWLEGARTWIGGGSFAMNPYSPPPQKTYERRSRVEIVRNLAWCDGYWWATKHRGQVAKPEFYRAARKVTPPQTTPAAGEI